MKRQTYANTGKIFLSILLILLFSIYISAQNFRSVQDGVEYAEMTRQIDNQPIKMNLLRLDLNKVRLDVVHAMDAAIGTETTSSIAARHGAIAAINAGFFRLDKSIFAGDAAGVLMIDGKLLSESINNRTALGIINKKRKTEVVFGQLEASGLVGYFTNGSKKFDGINRERKKNEIILYTPEIKQTPTVEYKTTEIVFTDCEFGCRRVEVVENKGGSPIPKDGYIVSVGETANKEFLVEFMKKRVGAELKERATFFDFLMIRSDKNPALTDYKKMKKFKEAEDIVAGVPQLIKNGKIAITWEQEKSSKSFVETRHPRTAVAKLKNGKFLMITVDGRQAESAGIGLEDLAKLLLELGATDAMNLDGGGSTTMFLNGKVVNRPSDKEGERKVSDAILVFLRKK
jgi:exopolysaccharide biosynthesis protein